MARPAAIPVRVDMALSCCGATCAKNCPAATAEPLITEWS